MKTALFLAATTLVLTACGGGSSDKPAAATTTTVPTTQVQIVFVTSEVAPEVEEGVCTWSESRWSIRTDQGDVLDVGTLTRGTFTRDGSSFECSGEISSEVPTNDFYEVTIEGSIQIPLLDVDDTWDVSHTVSLAEAEAGIEIEVPAN